AAAHRWFDESLGIWQESEDVGTARAARKLGNAATRLGRYAEARQYYREAITVACRYGLAAAAAGMIEGLAAAVTLEGVGRRRAKEAAMLFGASARLREADNP